MFLGDAARERIEIGPTAKTIRPPLSNSLLASRDNSVGELTETDMFYRVMNQLESDYVESVKDEQQFAVGSIRGMVASLLDPDCVFLTKEQVQLYRSEANGHFKGIGADLELQFDTAALEKFRIEREKARQTRSKNPNARPVESSSLVPRLIVAGVMPGSPAEKAGLKAGDEIDSVDGRWVISSRALKEFAEMQKQFAKGGDAGPEVVELRKKLQERAKTGITPNRTREQLTQGTTGSVTLTWYRQKQVMKAVVQRATTDVPAVVSHGSGVYSVRFWPGAEAQLAEAIKGKQSITLDLRNSGKGDFETFKKCLALIAPTNNYGAISKQGGSADPLSIDSGAPSNLKISLLADGSTHSASEMFVRALADRNVAKVQGNETANDFAVIEFIQLPDGSGYLLRTGTYVPVLREMKKEAA